LHVENSKVQDAFFPKSIAAGENWPTIKYLGAIYVEEKGGKLCVDQMPIFP